MLKKYLFTLAVLICLLFIQHTLHAAYPEYENIYVNDWADLLDDKTETSITQKLKKLRTESGVEITLLTIDSMNAYPDTANNIEDFSHQLFNLWGVGEAQRNDGVLVLVSHSDRKMRIATGTAYDETSKNAVAKSIIDNYFIPSFKRDNYQIGILEGMSRVIQEFNPNSSAVLGLMGAAKQTVSHTTSNSWYELKNSPFLLFLLIAGGIVLLNLLKSLAGRVFANNSEEGSYYARANYVVDKQPKYFKQVFPDEKKVEKKRFIVAFFLGLIALIFIAAFIGFNAVKVGFFALLAGLGISYGIAELSVRKRNKPKVCPRCSNKMVRLSEIKDDKHLELPERVEESLKSVDYDVWLCGDCQRSKKLAYPYWFTSIKECEQCEYRTLQIDSNTLRSATTSNEGLREVIEDCKYCDYHHEYEEVIPRESDNDSGSSSSSSSSSFGGGSSSGGGASGSW